MCDMPVGPGELLLILVVILFIVLMVRGPKMLPQIGEAVGKTIKGVRGNLAEDDATSDASTSDATSDSAASESKDQATAETDKDDAGSKPGT
jgi:sec-independent protein translocase protein TatA